MRTIDRRPQANPAGCRICLSCRPVTILSIYYKHTD